MATEKQKHKKEYIFKHNWPLERTLFHLNVLTNSQRCLISPLEIIKWNILKIQTFHQAPLKQKGLLKSDTDTVMSWSLVCNWTGGKSKSRNGSRFKSLLHWVNDMLSKWRNKSNCNLKAIIWFIETTVYGMNSSANQDKFMWFAGGRMSGFYFWTCWLHDLTTHVVGGGMRLLPRSRW